MTRSAIIGAVLIATCSGLASCAARSASTQNHPTAARSDVMPFYRPAGTGPAVWGPGDLYTLLVTGKESGGSLFQFEAEVPTGGGPPQHVHAGEDESFYVVKGTLEVRLGDRVIAAGPGDFVFIPRGTPHSFRNVGTETAVQLVTFTPAGFERFFEEVFPSADRAATPPPMTDELLQKMNQAASRHRLLILPPQ